MYNHEVFGPLKGRGGDIGGKTDEELVRDLINIHNAENWLGIDGDPDMSILSTSKQNCDVNSITLNSETKGNFTYYIHIYLNTLLRKIKPILAKLFRTIYFSAFYIFYILLSFLLKNE